MSPISQAGVFLVDTFFHLYVLLILLRFLLQLSGASFYNPICQFLVKATKPVLAPLHKLIPVKGGWDIAALLSASLLEMLKIFMLMVMVEPSHPGLDFYLILTVMGILKQLINIYFFAIFIRVILSWFNSMSYSPMTEVLYVLTRPILEPVQKRMPNMGGIDLSPLVVVIGLQLLKILVIGSLAQLL